MHKLPWVDGPRTPRPPLPRVWAPRQGKPLECVVLGPIRRLAVHWTGERHQLHFPEVCPACGFTSAPWSEHGYAPALLRYVGHPSEEVSTFATGVIQLTEGPLTHVVYRTPSPWLYTLRRNGGSASMITVERVECPKTLWPHCKPFDVSETLERLYGLRWKDAAGKLVRRRRRSARERRSGMTLAPADLADFLKRYGGDLLELRCTFSKRHLFAAAVMQGLSANPGWNDWTEVEIAEFAVKTADALLAELAKPAPTLGGRMPWRRKPRRAGPNVRRFANRRTTSRPPGPNCPTAREGHFTSAHDQVAQASGRDALRRSRLSSVMGPIGGGVPAREVGACNGPLCSAERPGSNPGPFLWSIHDAGRPLSTGPAQHLGPCIDLRLEGVKAAK